MSFYCIYKHSKPKTITNKAVKTNRRVSYTNKSKTNNNMSYQPACVPITRKIAEFKQTKDTLNMSVEIIGGINGVYSKRLEDEGICTVGQLKKKTRCMTSCEFEKFLYKKACVHKLHAAMAYTSLYGRVDKKKMKKALSKKTTRC